MTQKNTPTPWGFDGDGFDSIAAKMCDTDGYTIFPVDSEGAVIGCIAEIVDMGDDDEAKANAEFIVKCVNAHDELVALLSEAQTDLISVKPHSSDLPHRIGYALAKARGEA